MKHSIWTKLTLILFAALILAVPLCWLLPQRDFSPTERRYLAKAPKLTDQDVRRWTYGTDVEAYFADHLPLRDALVGIDAYVTLLTGRQVSRDVWMDADGYLVEAPMPREEQGLKKRLNKIAALGETTGLRPFVLAVPSTGYIRQERLPNLLGRLYPDEALLKVLEETQGLTSVNIADTFRQQGQNWYYATDHHWNGLGAFAAYEAYMAAAGHAALSYDDFSHDTLEGYTGSTLSRSAWWLTKGDRLTVDIPHDTAVTITFSDREGTFDSLFFYEHLQSYDWYPLFIDGNHPLTVIENQAAPSDSPVLLMVKDSFGNTLTPLLVPSYRRIVMVDPRYYRGSVAEVCKEYGAQELLFCYSLERLMTDANLQIIK